jgi:riboflavin biosynthesis pyrimidine reductase
MKDSGDRDIGIGGPGLAATAFRAGLVDEIQLFLSPIVAGGGTRALPDGVRVRLALEDQRRSEDGTVFLRYRTA